MTAKLQREAIARHLGWRIGHSSETSEPWGHPPGTPLGQRGVQVLPYWPTDLNAMHGLEEALDPGLMVRYVNFLIDHALFSTAARPEGLHGLDIRWTLLKSPADVRCKAWLLTFNLWTD